MQQEKIIAIIFVVAAMVFSAVTYSFAHTVYVVQENTPVMVVPHQVVVNPVELTQQNPVPVRPVQLTQLNPQQQMMAPMPMVQVRRVDYGVPGLNLDEDNPLTGQQDPRLPKYKKPPKKYTHVHDNDIQFPNGGRFRSHDKVVIKVKATNYGYKYHVPAPTYTVYEVAH